MEILRVEHLKKIYGTKENVVRAVDDVSYRRDAAADPPERASGRLLYRSSRDPLRGSDRDPRDPDPDKSAQCDPAHDVSGGIFNPLRSVCARHRCGNSAVCPYDLAFVPDSADSVPGEGSTFTIRYRT